MESKISSKQLWVDIIPHFEINQRLEYYGDASLRVIFEENKTYTMVARPSVFYHLNPIVESNDKKRDNDA